MEDGEREGASSGLRRVFGNVDDENLARSLTRVALIAGVYAALTLAFFPLSYGAIQVRISEALTVLPFLTPLAVPGLFIGCLLANLLAGQGFNDVVFGSLATFVAAYMTSRVRRPILAPLPPIIVNALVVPAYLAPLVKLPYVTVALFVAAGETIACYALGYPLLLYLRRNAGFRLFFQ